MFKGILDNFLDTIKMNEDDFYDDEPLEDTDELDGEEYDEEADFTEEEHVKPAPKTRKKRGLFSSSKTEKAAKKSRTRSYDEEEDDVKKDLGDLYSDSFQEESEDDFHSKDSFEHSSHQSGTSYGGSANSIPRNSKITPIKRRSNSYMNSVCILSPVNIEHASQIGDCLQREAVVILNLEGIDLDDAQRIVDFASGCVYALDANLHKVSEYFFVLTPKAVSIEGDFQNTEQSPITNVGSNY